MEYIVKTSDSLSTISENFFSDPNKYVDIKDLNDLSDDEVYPGQRILIPSISKLEDKRNLLEENEV